MIHRNSWKAAVIWSVGVTLVMVMVSAASAADPLDKDARKQVRIFERDLDDLLIDSPYWLVPGRDNARAYHLPGNGLLVTFQASLVSQHDGWSFRFFDHRWDGDDDDDRDRDRDRDPDRKRDRDRGRDSDRESRRYERGKEELVDFLLEYARDLEFLKGTESLTLVAYLGDADHFWDNDLERLEMRVKVDDIKANASGSLSDEQAQTKIVTNEY